MKGDIQSFSLVSSGTSFSAPVFITGFLLNPWAPVLLNMTKFWKWVLTSCLYKSYFDNLSRWSRVYLDIYIIYICYGVYFVFSHGWLSLYSHVVKSDSIFDIWLMMTFKAHQPLSSFCLTSGKDDTHPSLDSSKRVHNMQTQPT